MQEEKQHLLRMKAGLHYIELVEKMADLGALEGKVGPQGMGLYGGAHQAYIDYRAVPADWIEITPATWK